MILEVRLFGALLLAVVAFRGTAEAAINFAEALDADRPTIIVVREGEDWLQ